MVHCLWVVATFVITACLFYWIGHLNGFYLGTNAYKENMRSVVSSVFEVFYEMKKKID